ncbi:MAG: GAF domain-containing protein [Lachnospiraceae bacterium]|nr:GAF domain-containing protein [Lachnospiraceae bacterium]
MRTIQQSYSSDPKALYGQILDEKLIQKTQKRFSEVSNLFIICTDEKGQWITDITGEAEDVQRIRELIPAEKWKSIYARIANSTLEEQVVEDTEYPNVKLAAISIRSDNKPVMNWLICAVLEDYDTSGYHRKPVEIRTMTSTHKFYQALDLLRESSFEIMDAKVRLFETEAENRRSKSSQEEMTVSLKRTEAITTIVQMLESDDAIESIMEEILRVAGKYLETSSAQVFRLNKDGETMDVMAEWGAPGVVSVFDQVRNIPMSPLLRYQKTMAISSETRISVEEREVMEASHTMAAMVIPVYINNQLSMYVCFNECQYEREWQIEEIKFANNATKVLQSILIRRIQKNSLLSSYTSLEAILDNVGSAIYVKDIVTKKVLFVNKMLRNNFDKEYKDGTLDELFEKGQPIGNKGGTFEINHILKNRWYDLHYTYIKWGDGRQVALCMISQIKRYIRGKLSSRRTRIS